MLRPYYWGPPSVGEHILPRQPAPGDADHFLDELVVAEPGGARRLGETRVHGRIRKDARQRVQLEDVPHAESVNPKVDAAPVAASERVVGVERGALDLAIQPRRNSCRALEDREWGFGAVPHPLRLVA